MNEHMCPEHNKAMLESKHREGEFYCPVKVGDHPQSGKALYCTNVYKPGAALPPTPPPPPTTSSQPPPPVQRNGGMSQSDKERITRLACLKAACTLYRGEGEVSASPIEMGELMIDCARTMYEWAMSGDADAPAPAEDVEGTEGSDWYKRTALVTNAMATIPYYEHVKHLLAAMKIMEDAGDIAWGMDDDTVVANLSAYAHRRANEKAELQ